MKLVNVVIVLAMLAPALAQEQEPAPSLKSILLEPLRSTDNNAEWFVPANTAVEGLTAEQANWTDGKGNHSVGQLVNHLIFSGTAGHCRNSKASHRKNSAATTTRRSTASTPSDGVLRLSS